jgi:hypothetical protein
LPERYARAHFHAAWWDDPRLGASVGTRPDAEALAAYLDRFAARFADFIVRLGDGLPRERRGLLERLMDRGGPR